MKVLVVHNSYLQRGGEDAVAEDEVALLRSNGHEVLEYRRRNEDIVEQSALASAADSWWSRRTVREMRSVLGQMRPDVVHVHNTWPLISPSVYWVAAAEGVAVVQTLHNFRWMCPQALLLRQGQVCQSCVGRLPWPGVLHGCYQGSRAKTAVLGGMLTFHRGLGTWHRKVQRYIALNEFCKGKFIEAGLPADRIVVKPNFVDLPAPDPTLRDGLLYVGRLSEEKGVQVLAEASRHLTPGCLKVAGVGPQASCLEGLPAIDMQGMLKLPEVAALMRRARALVLPSLLFENFPRTVVEAFACGLPVIASRLGALADLIEDGVTGLHFHPADASDLQAKMQWALDHPSQMEAMGRAARQRFEQHYTPQINLAQLLAIYQDAMAQGTS